MPGTSGWGGGRARILAAALEEHGEAAIRSADVAARAGVVPNVVAHHFRNREGLLAALHEHRYTGLVTLDTTPAPPEDHVLVITRALGAFRTDPTG